MRIDQLKGFENACLKVFNCDTTFERSLAIPGMLPVLERTASELGAPLIQTRVAAVIETLTTARTTQARNRALNLHLRERYCDRTR
jgi:hypothetical protein